MIAGGLVFVSGQGPFDPVTGSIVGETIQEQTRQVLKNCDAILRAAGSSMAKVVRRVRSRVSKNKRRLSRPFLNP